MEAKIKPQDLRIGNLVQYNQGDKVIPTTVSCLFETFADLKHINDECISSSIDYEFIDVIELTDEWLLNFGFEIEEIHAGLSEADFGHNPVTKDFIITLKNTGNGWFYRNGYFKIQFVHQLQNLYFALTGEELTLIETKKMKLNSDNEIFYCFLAIVAIMIVGITAIEIALYYFGM